MFIKEYYCSCSVLLKCMFAQAPSKMVPKIIKEKFENTHAACTRSCFFVCKDAESWNCVIKKEQWKRIILFIMKCIIKVWLNSRVIATCFVLFAVTHGCKLGQPLVNASFTEINNLSMEIVLVKKRENKKLYPKNSWTTKALNQS